MDERIEKWLYDVKIAIDEVDDFFETNPKDFTQYQNNILLKRAVERELDIIGEAVRRIINRDNSYLNKIQDAKTLLVYETK